MDPFTEGFDPGVCLNLIAEISQARQRGIVTVPWTSPAWFGFPWIHEDFDDASRSSYKDYVDCTITVSYTHLRAHET